MEHGHAPNDPYQGQRILEAMRSAPAYAEHLYRQIRRVPLGKNAHVLDFGAGDGVFVEKFVGDSIDTECVEPDISLRHLLEGRGTRVYADVKDVRSHAYDLIYTVNVLEHIHSLPEPLAELRRALKPDGYLFAFVPAFDMLWTSLDAECAHVQRFTKSSLRRVLVDAGFEVIEQRYFDSLGFPAALTVRALEKVGLFEYSPQSVGFYDRAIFPLSKRLDVIARNFLGKNVLAVARPAKQQSQTTKGE